MRVQWQAKRPPSEGSKNLDMGEKARNTDSTTTFRLNIFARAALTRASVVFCGHRQTNTDEGVAFAGYYRTSDFNPFLIPKIAYFKLVCVLAALAQPSSAIVRDLLIKNPKAKVARRLSDSGPSSNGDPLGNTSTIGSTCPDSASKLSDFTKEGRLHPNRVPTSAI
jgi:hypothetical protein